MAPASVAESCTAFATIVDSTVSRSSVEFTAWLTSPRCPKFRHRSAKVFRASPWLVQQTRVLNGDHGLTGKRCECRSLLFGERASGNTDHAKRTNGRLVAYHGDDGHGPIAAGHEAPCDRKFRWRVFGVRDVDDLTVENGGTVHVFACQSERKPAPPRLGSRRICESDSLDLISVGKRDADRRTRKELQAALDDGIEHRLRVRK